MKKIPLAVQLYSVHKSVAKDMPGTLSKVAAMGYQGVEFYGGFLWPADEVKAALEANSLKIVGWHIPYSSVAPENIYATIAYCKTVGTKYLAVPGLPEEMRCSEQAWQDTAEKFMAAAKVLNAHGIVLGYHNHGEEFTIYETRTAWDIIIGDTQGLVFGQLDNGNAMSGGADPMHWLKKYPGRAVTCHLKPYSLKDGFDTMIGRDDVPWDDFFAELDRQNVTEWYIVEYESEKLYGDLEGVELCMQELKKMGL